MTTFNQFAEWLFPLDEIPKQQRNPYKKRKKLMTEYMEEPRNPGVDDGHCGVCKKDKGLTEEDRCHGCGYLICDAHFGDPWGQHLVVQHDDEEE